MDERRKDPSSGIPSITHGPLHGHTNSKHHTHPSQSRRNTSTFNPTASVQAKYMINIERSVIRDDGEVVDVDDKIVSREVGMNDVLMTNLGKYTL